LGYQYSLQMAEFLTSDDGAEWLETSSQFVASPSSHLAEVEYLRKHLSPAKSAAILEQVRLRAKAKHRFPNAEKLLFTDTGLQQATHPAVAAHRARRYAGQGFVADIGCGIGSDTVALSRVAGIVAAVDRDPVRLFFARHNVSATIAGSNACFIGADARQPPFAIAGAVVFCDPSRRTRSGERIYQPQAYEPSLPAVRAVYARAGGLGIKVSPGISFDQIPWADEVELISYAGIVREAVLWVKALATPGVQRRATVLPAGNSVTDAERVTGCPVRRPGRFIYEPDGAVIRAGLVQQVCEALEMWQLDHRIAYLSSDSWRSSAFVQGFEIEECLPFSLKRIRRRLQELGVGVLEIKKRGVNLDPDAFRRRLRLNGQEEKTLILTRIGDRPVAFLCQRKRTGSPLGLPVNADVF
jgi:SAM-dependent methyltransferase